MADPNFENELAQIEKAALVMMAQNVNENERREAESYFMQLKKSNISPQLCQTVLNSATEPFVLFQISQCFSVSMSRNYNAYSSEDVDGACKFLLELPSKKPNLPAFVVSELLKSAATIYKCGRKCSSELVLGIVTSFLQDASDVRQTLGLQIIEAMCMEHATLWRSTISMSYRQFQIAKRRFEDQLLKKFMELSLACLSKIVSEHINNEYSDVCARFLRISVIVLQWNFKVNMASSVSFVPLYNFEVSVILRPPSSWSDLFTNEQLIPFFFALHQKVRSNPEISQHSLGCLVQLAGLNGSIWDADRGKQIKKGEASSRDLYLRRFCTSLIEVFNDCHSHEMLQFSTILFFLFNQHRVMIFRKFPPELFKNFIKFIVHWACRLVGPAMIQDRENDEFCLIESLEKVFQTWRLFMSFCDKVEGNVDTVTMEQNSLIIQTFMNTVLAPPYGQKTFESIVNPTEEELEDHIIYKTVLLEFGMLCRGNIKPVVDYIIGVFCERIGQRQFVENVPNDQRQLWSEDIHWLLLITDSFFNYSDFNIAKFLEDAYKAKQYAPIEMHPFFAQCFRSMDSLNSDSTTDPIVKLFGVAIHWTGIFLQSLEAQGSSSPFASPKVCRSTISTFAKVINFFTDLNKSWGSKNTLPELSTDNQQSAYLIEVVIRLCFIAFQVFPNEKSVCKAAVALLTQESSKRPVFIAKSPLLYEKLLQPLLSHVHCRRDFMSCMMKIESKVPHKERSQMNEMVLQPLVQHFASTAQAFQSGQLDLVSQLDLVPQLIGLLECFVGVAKSSDREASNTVYNYLAPVLHGCVHLMAISTETSFLTNAILDFYKCVSMSLLSIVDFQGEDAPLIKEQDNFFNLLHALIGAYKASQMKRFQAALPEVEEQEQVADLVTLLQTVGYTVDNSYKNTKNKGLGERREEVISKEVLEMTLLLLNEDALRLPSLSVAFYEFVSKVANILFLVLLQLDSANIEKLFGCLCWAIGGASGLEATKIALETVQSLCKMLRSSKDSARESFMQMLFKFLAGKVFEVSFNSYVELEVELQLDAIRSLFYIVLLNPQYFTQYAQTLFSQGENANNYARLMGYFERLMATDKPMLDMRQSFEAFNTRFEKFVEMAGQVLTI